MGMTQKELAEQLNVSPMTVSRALRGEPGVSSEVRQAILAAAHDSGYTVESNYHAKLLKGQHDDNGRLHHVVCVMLPHSQREDDAHSFFGKILRGIEEAANELDMEIILVSQELDRLPRIVLRRQVDGLVRFTSPERDTDGLGQCPVPQVSVITEFPGVDVVTVANYGGGQQLGEHFCELGHRRLAFIGPDVPIAHKRLAGLRAALNACGGRIDEENVRFAPAPDAVNAGRELVEQLIDSQSREQIANRFTGLVAYNDYMAIHAIEALKARGLRVPEDVSVAGFDGAAPRGMRRQEEQLTTAAMPLAQLGAETLRLLCARLAHPEGVRRRLVLDVDVIRGKTTAPPSNR